ncbi:3-ketoacyl-ACP reductase [Mycolicibacterium moriokaense]|jgi:SDR family mycofactocin-dependent oxidoreductase|uniref:3-ketoacyl-ACP reductase n=1 Tax=Mycolicibacterium moriokaense TaxID=39691 RepID=A0AAD1M8Q4_9MYCO|nr:mycofactocin-coupled SDR family oxidoreductase [Mycolicibacterium moriokaense]MCV7039245.1 mycofactocin-coupled SDR family oxidoreductase [Mycolicibacterium moriokaense]ORB26903.1 3-ketoacyl-ACP reductase [Mycolicibacterium moriokaense]BBX03765.1 3-ketoacyl-ACP reductase [Mycolicibacterium moriokaense]
MTDRVVLITGAARGQGRAHAERLSADGADVILVDIAAPLPPSVPYDSATPDDLAETAKLVAANGRRAFSACVDIRDHDALCEAVDAGVAELGRLDVIVANAGICVPATWDKVSPQDFQDTIDINVVGTWNTVMAGAKHIVAGGRGGSIILISSAAGLTMEPFMIAYTASKHAVTGLARSFAAELGKHRIRVNSLHPGSVVTPMGSVEMVEAMVEAATSNPVLRHGFSKQVIPDSVALPEDIADAVAWLASDQAKYVTAAAIPVDLGVTGT